MKVDGTRGEPCREMIVSFGGFSKLEREAITLTNGDVAFAVFIPGRERRRQRPDSLLVALFVLRIGVDLRSPDQLEADAFDERDREILIHVARHGIRVLRYARITAVLDNAKHSARLERSVHRLERFSRPTEGHPIVQVAERYDEICRACRRDRRLCAPSECRHDHLIVHLGKTLELRTILGNAAARILACLRIELRSVQDTAVAYEGCEDLGVPAGAGPDLHDGHVRARTEEQERLLGMAVGIACATLLRAIRRGENAIELRSRAGLTCTLGGAACHDGDQTAAENTQTHSEGPSP